MLDRLKFLRKEVLKLTQNEFAKQIYLKQNTYSKIENGHISLTERNIKNICEAFNVNEDWLVNNNLPIMKEKIDNNININHNLDKEEIEVLKAIILLSEESRNKIIKFIIDILKNNLDNIDI